LVDILYVGWYIVCWLIYCMLVDILNVGWYIVCWLIYWMLVDILNVGWYIECWLIYWINISISIKIKIPKFNVNGCTECFAVAEENKQRNSTSEADIPSGKCNILSIIITMIAAENRGPLTHLTGALRCLYKHNHFLPPKQSDTAE
jgi:uncharacterized protein with PQ loop repeat